ncbi:hypothetical protein PoB_007493000 [Plakobranchus ocellatus]|uniref:Uncharacterized protein n=1 Tax=Plakobranchus ocellatus TaxID=259542 RepID=A0AAV4DWN6_9GAST|nr:hypothetical protein PoB_007493000 [Plakobranchus ocellatus]
MTPILANRNISMKTKSFGAVDQLWSNEKQNGRTARPLSAGTLPELALLSMQRRFLQSTAKVNAHLRKMFYMENLKQERQRKTKSKLFGNIKIGQRRTVQKSSPLSSEGKKTGEKRLNGKGQCGQPTFLQTTLYKERRDLLG